VKPPPGPDQKKLWTHEYDTQANYIFTPTAIEIEVHPHAAKARQRSANKYNKRHTIEAFPPGDVVSIRVPREDRAAADLHRIFCRVLAIPHHNRYKLQTAHEVLNVHYLVAVLTECHRKHVWMRQPTPRRLSCQISSPFMRHQQKCR